MHRFVADELPIRFPAIGLQASLGNRTHRSAPGLHFLGGHPPPPKRNRTGRCGGGEFAAKIFLKHWYLQCFAAIKALKPLF